MLSLALTDKRHKKFKDNLKEEQRILTIFFLFFFDKVLTIYIYLGGVLLL